MRFWQRVVVILLAAIFVLFGFLSVIAFAAETGWEYGLQLTAPPRLNADDYVKIGFGFDAVDLTTAATPWNEIGISGTKLDAGRQRFLNFLYLSLVYRLMTNGSSEQIAFGAALYANKEDADVRRSVLNEFRTQSGSGNLTAITQAFISTKAGLETSIWSDSSTSIDIQLSDLAGPGGLVKGCSLSGTADNIRSKLNSAIKGALRKANGNPYYDIAISRSGWAGKFSGGGWSDSIGGKLVSSATDDEISRMTSAGVIAGITGGIKYITSFEKDTNRGIEQLREALENVKELQAKGLWLDCEVTGGADTATGFPAEYDILEQIRTLSNDATTVNTGEILFTCERCLESSKQTSGFWEHLKSHCKDERWTEVCNFLSKENSLVLVYALIGGDVTYRKWYLDGCTGGSPGEADYSSEKFLDWMTGVGSNTLESLYREAAVLFGLIYTGDTVEFNFSSGKFSNVDWDSNASGAGVLGQVMEKFYGALKTALQGQLSFSENGIAVKSAEARLLALGIIDDKVLPTMINEFLDCKGYGLGEVSAFRALHVIASTDTFGEHVSGCSICSEMYEQDKRGGNSFNSVWIDNSNTWQSQNWLHRLEYYITHVVEQAVDSDTAVWQPIAGLDITLMRYCYDAAEINTQAGWLRSVVSGNSATPEMQGEDWRAKMKQACQDLIAEIWNSNYRVQPLTTTQSSFRALWAQEKKYDLGEIADNAGYVNLKSLAEYREYVVDVIDILSNKVLPGYGGYYSYLDSVNENLSQLEGCSLDSCGHIAALESLISVNKVAVLGNCKASELLSHVAASRVRVALTKSLISHCSEECASSFPEYQSAYELSDSEAGARVVELTWKVIEHYIEAHLGGSIPDPGGDPAPSPDPGDGEDTPPYNPGDPQDNIERRYRPEIEANLSGETVIKTPQGVTNTLISEAIAQQRQVDFWGALLKTIMFSVGEFILAMSAFYALLYVITRTSTFFPREWLRKLSFNKIDAYDTSIPRFMTMFFIVTLFGIIFVMGYAYDIIVWVVAKLVMLLGLM